MLVVRVVADLPAPAVVHRAEHTLLLVRDGIPFAERQNLMLELLTPPELAAALQAVVDRPIEVPRPPVRLRLVG